MTYTKFVLFLSILIFVIFPVSIVSAQDEPLSDDSLIRSISLGSEAMVISSPTNDQDYLIHVYLPIGYRDDASKLYPVLYLFDPWYTFGTVTDQIRLAGVGDRELPDIIVVGVGYPGILDQLGPDRILSRRIRDLNPDREPEPFLEFLTKTLIPHIDSTYNSDPNDRAIMGHSYGGDFVLYTLVNAPEMFHRFIAASPGYSPVCITCELENGIDISGVIFLSAGEIDGPSPRYVEKTFLESI
jgi:enterochelin esterase-like enzyme